MSNKSLTEYINKIQYNSAMAKEIITVEHRCNNPKRDFLFVNRVQGKHIPAKPSDTIKMMKDLADRVNIQLDKDDKHSTLVIGFCETATALGQLLADNTVSCHYYLQTSREELDAKKLFDFLEEHSHAANQSIYIDETKMTLDKLKDFDSILFMDDEISTGKTIINFVDKFRTLLVEAGGTGDVDYYVASICNWQSLENKEKFIANGIKSIALIEGELTSDSLKMDVEIDNQSNLPEYTEIELNNLIDKIEMHMVETGVDLFKLSRCGLSDSREVSDIINKIQAEVLSLIGDSTDVDIISTEEFMYIPMMVASAVDADKVTFHATTRSHIDILKYPNGEYVNSLDKDITNCYKLHSAYDDNRDTYIYNMRPCDILVVITDSHNVSEEFIKDLAKVVKVVGIKRCGLVLL